MMLEGQRIPTRTSSPSSRPPTTTTTRDMDASGAGSMFVPTIGRFPTIVDSMETIGTSLMTSGHAAKDAEELSVSASTTIIVVN